MDKIRLLIASEDSSSRRGLAAIFASESMFSILGSFPLSEVNDKAALFQPDVILFDISGDVSKCNQEIKQIKTKCPCSLILVLVENEQYDKLDEVLLQGIDGCVPRGIIRGYLVKVVELACRACLFYMPGSLKKMISFAKQNNVINIGKLKNDLPGSVDTLTKREMEILQLMVKNYSNREIAGKLFISEPTVKTHVSSILRKLGQNNRAQAIVYSYKIGLIS